MPKTRNRKKSTPSKRTKHRTRTTPRGKGTKTRARAKRTHGHVVARTAARGVRGRRKPKYFELRDSPIQGKGAFATRKIRKGTRIIEYTGERITHEEADERYDDKSMKRHHTFLFTLDDWSVVDAAVGGNEARFINHSCAPNCEAVIEDERIFIEALRTIVPGTELVYDYAYEWERGESKHYPCRCGAENCRGTIMKPPPKKKKRR
jgi:SET domain-containing protein